MKKKSKKKEAVVEKKRGRPKKDSALNVSPKVATKTKKVEESGFDLRLHSETKKSIMAVIFFGVAIILLLANFGQAGPAGDFAYSIFAKIIGSWGYYLLPLIFLIMGGVFLTSERRKIYGVTFFGAALFVLSGLGFIDIVFTGEKAGFLGQAAGSIESLFGYIASLVVIIVLMVVSFLVTLNLPIKLRRKVKEIFEENEEDESEEEELSEVDEAIVEEMQEEKPESVEPAPSIKDKIVAAMPAMKVQKGTTFNIKDEDYVFPPIDLLKSSVEKPTSGDLRANANIIKRTLESFGIVVEMGEINIGPKVTRYTLKPAEGVKLSRITALAPDLALALAAHPIRIEAPIPGKSLVGIEVPNRAAAVVRLGSLISYPEFASTGPMSFVVGRDVTGEPLFADIRKMPHMLVAGATGSGKSVTVHSIILSLLYKNSPKNLKFLMIDPKRVELSVYTGIPHMIAPVVTQAKKSLGVFRWAISEMDRRYELFLKAGSRDIGSYNKKNEAEPLPYIVIIVDELADLMSTYGREVEGYIVRLAQMARATGIHLILSTQRPSVEVITGLIKANIPGRIALQVASQIDSRTILDGSGAEKLLGSGDMLIVSPEISKPKRIQGCYISEEEIGKVADFIKEKNQGIMGEENAIEEGRAEGDNSSNFLDSFDTEDEEDDLMEEALEVVREAQKASTSLLQRRLKIGYSRAARIIDIMEAKGLVGPARGAAPREVYMQKDE